MRGERALAAVLVALLLPAIAASAQPRATVELRGGGLAAAAPEDVELPPARVSGAPVTVEAPVGPFRVTDTRGAAAGWTLVVAAERPVDALGRALGAPLVIEPAASVAGSGGLIAGASGPLDVPRALVTAPPGTGTGVTEVTPLLRVTVPADAATGVYSTTIIATVS